MSIVKPIASDSPGWIARLLRFLRARTPVRKGGEDSRAAPADEPPPHPLLIPNPNPKPWETLFEEHEPAGEDFLAVRPTMVAIKDGRAIFKQPDE
ncbi:MAG: hypothetical protein MPK08_03450 [Alphaproteobacteria bacterium]|nr:hypothetical protein [Alphaproteobacteria bacterium]